MSAKPIKIFFAIIFLTALSLGTSATEMVRLGGVGSITPLAELLARDFQQRNPKISVQISPVPLGSSGSFRALAAQKIDLALTGRRPKNSEPTGDVLLWARTPLVFASKDGIRPKGFSLKDIADIYAERLNVWDNNKSISLVMRNSAESETANLKAMSPDIAASVNQALARPGMTVAENDLDAFDILSRNAGSFGTVALGLVRSKKSTLNIFSVDGHLASSKGVANSAYPWFRYYWLVKGTSLSASTEKFVAYLQSPPAINIMERYEFLAGH